MSHYLMIAVITLASAGLSWFFCGLVRKRLIADNRFDTPNQRSMHTVKVPRGGGWGLWITFPIIYAACIAWLIFTTQEAEDIISVVLFVYTPLFIGAGLLIFISWRDDKYPTSVLMRLGFQVAAVYLGMMALSDKGIVTDFVPYWLDRIIIGVGWLWFINLYNFMDGIDGLTGSETAHLTLSYAVLMHLILALTGWFSLLYTLILLGAVLGFLVWNWHPAKLFMGDVGSIPLGYLTGYLLLRLADNGYLAIALTLPLYYVADATITLFKRLLRREKIWEAHREHFYQRAALKVGHKPVLYAIIATNALLLALSIISLFTSVWVLIGGPLIVAALLWYLSQMAQQPVKA